MAALRVDVPVRLDGPCSVGIGDVSWTEVHATEPAATGATHAGVESFVANPPQSCSRHDRAIQGNEEQGASDHPDSRFQPIDQPQESSPCRNRFELQ